MKKKIPSEVTVSSDIDDARAMIQGYDLATARYKMNLYQKRIELALIQSAQSQIEGERYIAGRQIEVNVLYHPKVKIPTSLILQDDDSSNIYALRKAAKSMVEVAIEFKDAKGNWYAFSPFISAQIPKYGNYLEMEVYHSFWRAMCDFKRGYRKVLTKRAFALKTVYAIRFYEMFANHPEPISYSLSDLKAEFGLQDKYKQINDFVRKVIEPSKRELDESSPWSFNYQVKKDGRKITGFDFFPYYIKENDAPEAVTHEAQRRTNVSWDIKDKRVRDYLKHNLLFEDYEIAKPHVKERIGEGEALIPNFLDFLAQVGQNMAKQGDNVKSRMGYLLNAIDKEKKALDRKRKPINPTMPSVGNIDDVAGSIADKFKFKSK